MIYLASAHTNFDRKVMQERFDRLCYVVAKMLNDGKMVYSPIVHCYPLAQAYNIRHDFEFWSEYNKWMIARADEFWIYNDPQGAWERSVGVQAELNFANAKGLVPALVHFDFLSATYTVTQL